MSVAWKTLTTDATCACGRMHAHQGCGFERRMSAKVQKGTPQASDFWAQDHFGLMERFKEER